MEIILVKPVKKVGKIGEIIKVKNGFGRNYLIPKNLAIRATDANKQLIEKNKANFETKNMQARLEAESIAKMIADKELIFIKQSSDDGRLFGSLTSKEIASAITKLVSYNISYANVQIESQIKSTGVFTVEIMLHAEVTVPVLIVVARSESEANNALMAHKASIEKPSSQEQEKA